MTQNTSPLRLPKSSGCQPLRGFGVEVEIFIVHADHRVADHHYYCGALMANPRSEDEPAFFAVRMGPLENCFRPKLS